jgi:4-amino-4-deoxy-L-arabinose transferase-like glycosyltransferase
MRNVLQGRWPAILLVLVVFTVLSTAVAITKAPWIDEGWFASPAHTLVTRGYMGTTGLEPTGTFVRGDLKNIDRFTYWVLPLYLLNQAAWYKMFGFGLLEMRAISMLWGAIAVFSLYILTRRLSGDPRIASVAALLLATDFTFLWGSTDGRMDAMTCSLGLAAAAIYITLRSPRFDAAFFVSHLLTAAAMLTHPNALLGFLILGFLTLRFDYARLRPHHLLAALPYLAGVAAWGLYIAQSPDSFVAQFTANAGTGGRFKGIFQPHVSLMQEVAVRYFGHFGFYPLWIGGVSRWAILVPLFYWFTVFAALRSAAAKAEAGIKTLALLAPLYLLAMIALTGFKASNYLVLIMPFYCASASVWLFAGERWKHKALIVGGVVALQLGITGSKIFERGRQRSYEPVAAFALSELRSGKSVMGPAHLGFALGFDRITDDLRLGYKSGKRADVIVFDRWYEHFWRFVLKTREPATLRHIEDTLARDYVLKLDQGGYKLYTRRAAYGSTTTGARRNANRPPA